MSRLDRRTILKGAAVTGAATLISYPALAQQNPIKIGFAMSLTGGLAAGGKQALLAFEIWRDEINAKGGLLGRPVQLVYFDDQSNPANVPGLYAKLIDIDKVDLVVSAYATNQITPALPIVMQKNMVYMGLFGTDVNAAFKYDRYFATIPNGPDGKRAPTLGFLEVAAGLTPKPQTIALVAADAEYAQTVIAGARETIAKLGFRTVYDRSYPPSTVDYAPIVRAVNAANPEVICIASYPPDSVGLIRAASELGVKPRIFGGAMIGLQFTAIQAQLGPLLNGIVNYDTYVPEPTMKFPGVDAFLKTYQDKAPAANVDLHGYFLPPFAYAQM
jgi:branched-chain amino acid transport system substrate-binding protein